MCKLFIALLIIGLGGAFLLSCGKKGISPKPDDRVEELKTKLDLYVELSREHQDPYGFVATDHCDSTLTSGLYGIHPDIDVVMEAVIDDSGQWYRRPNKDCLSSGSSKSTFSRDMATGAFWFMWKNQRLDLAERMWDYGVRHNWIMGQGVQEGLSRIYFTPSNISMLARLIYALGGEDHSARHIPLVFFKNSGFEAHLDVLNILLNAEMSGKIAPLHLEILKYQNSKNPKNALYNYAYHRYTDGNYSKAYDTLLNTALFPSDRLPTTEDRYSDYLWARDEGPDWYPRTSDRPQRDHEGVDFIFVATLILGL